MQEDRNKILVDSIKRLLRRDAVSHLKKIVNKTHAADLSIIFRSLSLHDQHKLFHMIEDTEQKGVLLSELDENAFPDFVNALDIDDIVAILEQMPKDDVADLIVRFPKEKADTILEKMNQEGSEEVEGLLSYKKDTAGGIMVPDFIALSEDTTAKEAIESLQKEHQDVEMPFYLYVLNEQEKLLGVISLRQLVVVPPQTPLKKFMTSDIFYVNTDTDQEEVAKLVARYDILAVPVVDDKNRLVGIVTVDDVIDIFRMEATEDILKMAGLGEQFTETQSIFKSTKTRLPWLFASCIGGILALFIIKHFESNLSESIFLAPFIPVIMGMGGNIGTQSSTIVVRGIATGRYDFKDLQKVVSKELAIGSILGIIYGCMIASVAQLQYNTILLSVSVSVAVFTSMSVAAFIGSMFPMIFARMNIDPAVATGPFVTSTIDIVSIFCYFKITTLLIGI